MKLDLGGADESKILKKINIVVPTELKALDRVLSEFDNLYLDIVPKRDWLKCRIALAEGFTNAVRHAHKDLPADTPIKIEAVLTPPAIKLTIWDYGNPFDLEAWIDRHLKYRQNLSEGARGILLLTKIADSLSYRHTEDGRNCLLMVKYIVKLPVNLDES
jgi:serine/threonine-protein kinase RsbW